MAIRRSARVFAARAAQLDVTARLEHVPGDKVSGDWTGDCPHLTDPVTGRTFQQTDTPENRAALARAVGDGLAMLRRCNPGALLVWAYGMLGAELRPTLEEAVARYCRESGDARACFLPLPPTEAADFGARHHPGVTAHCRAADTLTAFLERALAGQSPQGKPAEKDNR